MSGPSPSCAPPFAVCAALGRGCSDERLFRLYFHGGGRHLAKIPHCFAYKSFCFTAVLFALNVLLFQQLFIEPLYLQRGIARASGQSYQRIDSCGGGLCRDSFPSFDSVYQAAAGASGLPPLFISASSRKHSKADRQHKHKTIFSGRNFMRLQDNAAFAPLRCVLAGFFKSTPMRRPDLCLPGAECCSLHLEFPDGGSANDGFQSAESFRRYRVSVYIGAVGSPFHPEPSCRTSTYCSRDLENTISKLRIWRIVYGVIVGTDVRTYRVFVIWSRMQRPMY